MDPRLTGVSTVSGLIGPIFGTSCTGKVAPLPVRPKASGGKPTLVAARSPVLPATEPAECEIAMYDLEPVEIIDGELIDEAPDCQGGYRACTNIDVELVEDPYESDVNNTPSQLIYLCPACYDELCADI